MSTNSCRSIVANDAGLFKSWRLIVTPTRSMIEGPSPEQSTHIIRSYSEHQTHFLRVTFSDEDQEPVRHQQGNDVTAFVNDRFGRPLLNGLRVGGRAFNFLIYSMSGLREHTVFFMTPFTHLGKFIDGAFIRSQLGTFAKSETIPARCGARLSQAMSATDPTIVLTLNEIRPIRDVERNGYCFSDGVGTLSPSMARKIQLALAKGRQSRVSLEPASAYQIRLGGYKGMLVFDSRLIGDIVNVRPSMEKFDSTAAPLRSRSAGHSTDRRLLSSTDP